MQYRSLTKGMGEAVAKRTILRTKGDGSIETWGDVAERVAHGNSMLVTYSKEHSAKDEYNILKKHIANGSLLMSGRHLQHGDGSQITRNMEVFTNCSTAATSFLLFYLLLNGSGVGRAYDDDLCLVNWDFAPNCKFVLSASHPDFEFGNDNSLEEAKRKYKNAEFVVVGDSREGWAKVVEIIEVLAYEKTHQDRLIIFDFSQVRPKGSLIKGMQDRPASGPRPTMQAFESLMSIKGSGMNNWEQAMWVDHYLAECVLVGGARRSARMSTKYWKDKDVVDFVNIKRGGYLWSSNNSITVDEEFWRQDNEHSVKVLDSVLEAAYKDGTGEPGFINQDKLVQNDSGLDSFSYGDFVGSSKYKLEEPSNKLMLHLLKVMQGKKYTQITNPCVVGSTKIAVADGRNAVTIKQLTEEGQDIPVYSTDFITGQVQIKIARSPRKTKENAEIWKLKLDDGSELLATPDHKILTWDRGYVELQNLEKGDSIVPFYSYTSNDRYRQIARLGDEMSGGYFYSKRQYKGIYEFFNGLYDSDKFQIHHKDENSLNDNINNLDTVDSHQHLSEHMKRNNPYHQMTDEWKNNFASHKGELNGKWIKISNDDLIKHGKILFSRDGVVNTSNWGKYAKDNNLPQTLSNPARFGTFTNFVYQVVNNHKVVSVEFYGYDPKTNYLDENGNKIQFIMWFRTDDVRQKYEIRATVKYLLIRTDLLFYKIGLDFEFEK